MAQYFPTGGGIHPELNRKITAEEYDQVTNYMLLPGRDSGFVQDPKAKEEKAAHYAFIQTLADDFKKENGSIVCRELLGLNADGSPVPAPRTAEYYKKRPCAELVGDAARIIALRLQNR